MLQTLKGALYHSILYRPQNKVCEGYVFTRVCHSVHGGGLLPWGVPVPGGLLPGGCLLWGVPAPGGSAPRGVWRPPMKATAAGGTHPTGMHSCI